MTYAAVQGQLVVGNPYMDAMVELNKSETGMEDCVLATNTLAHEDATRAIAMLKAKMTGELIQPAEDKWTPDVQLRNLQLITQGHRQQTDRSTPEAIIVEPTERR